MRVKRLFGIMTKPVEQTLRKNISPLIPENGPRPKVGIALQHIIFIPGRAQCCLPFSFVYQQIYSTFFIPDKTGINCFAGLAWMNSALSHLPKTRKDVSILRRIKITTSTEKRTYQFQDDVRFFYNHLRLLNLIGLTNVGFFLFRLTRIYA